MGALLAAIVHELGHCLAVCLCQGQILSLSLTGNGAKIEASLMTPARQALCALAGPLGSFSVLLLAEHYPEAAVCAWIQGFYNLLPVFPLDGGRILYLLFSPAICAAVQSFLLVLFGGFSLWLMTKNLESGFIFFLSVCIPLIPRKLTCKESKQAVQ